MNNRGLSIVDSIFIAAMFLVLFCMLAEVGGRIKDSEKNIIEKCTEAK